MYKKELMRIAVAAFVVVIVAIAAGAWVLRHRVALASPVLLRTTSPNLTYTVKLAGQQDRPLLPAVVHTIRFNVTKNLDNFVVDKYLHSGDWLDPSYAMLFPQHSWVSENVLHLYREEYFSQSAPSTVVVTNSSSDVLTYLRLTSGSTYLLFDVQPGSKTELTIPPPRGDLEYIAAEGEFSESKIINKVGENFLVGKAPSVYYVDVGNNFITVESPSLRKYRAN